MAIMRASGTRSEVVRCPNCGEDYSVTYRRCPFCDERNRPTNAEILLDDDDDDETLAKNGKRLSGGRRGGGYDRPSPIRIAVTVLSLALIVAAVWIVFSWVAPLVTNSNIKPTPSTSPTTKITPAVPPSQPITSSNPGGNTGIVDPTVTPPVSTASPVPSSSVNTGKSFTLNRTDFTMDSVGETFTMKATGASGTVTWKSENPAVATVDASGKVTAVAKGQTTIVATASDGGVAKCVVRCRGGNAPASSQSSTAPSGTAKLNRTDFTLGKLGETFSMKLTGASGTPTWSSGNNAVVTIDSNGKVTAMAKGQTTITCQVDGKTLTCVVRCTF